MDTRRLEYLVQLARLGSMRDVSDEMGVTTSTVSQQLAALATEVGTPLLEPDGRRVRLTAAGRRLAGHAVTILAEVEAAQLDLDPDAEPEGVVRIAAFASSIRRSLLPLVTHLARHNPAVEAVILEHEPAEALTMLADDVVDVALVYDYNLAPLSIDMPIETTPLWEIPWSVAVPRHLAEPGWPDAQTVVGRYRNRPWIVNSRGTADERVVRTLASMAGFEARIWHRVDSLQLVQDLVVAGLGVGLLPSDTLVPSGVELVGLVNPDVSLRAAAAIRPGRAAWPPIRLVLGILAGVTIS